MPGVALGHSHVAFAWQTWHLVTWTLLLLGRRGTYGTGLAQVAHLGLRDAAGGMRGTWWHAPYFCVVGLALTALGWLKIKLCHTASLIVAHTSSIRNIVLSQGYWTHMTYTMTGTYFHNNINYCIHIALSQHALKHTCTHMHTCTRTHRHTTLSHITLSHTTLSDTTASRTTLSHTTLSHPSLSHATLSHSTLAHTHTTLSHVTLSRTTLSHITLRNSFTHATLSHTELCHAWLFHTHNSVIHSCVPHNSDTHNFTKPNSFAHSFVTHNYLTHNSFTHNSFTHSSDTHNSCTRNIVTHDSIRHSSVTYNSVTDAQLFHIHICHTIGLPPSPISFLPFSSKISDLCLLE